MLNKKVYLIIAVAVILVLACVIFCSVYFTVKVDVQAKLDKIFSADGTLIYSDSTYGTSDDISDTGITAFILDYLSDKKFTNVVYNTNGTIGIGGIIQKGENTIVIHDDKLKINGNWYKTDENISSAITIEVEKVIKGIV